MAMSSSLSFEQYVQWCLSNAPGEAPDHELESCPASSAKTVLAAPGADTCPVTVRSAQDDRVILTPRGSR